MRFFQRVLVPVDGSDTCRWTLRKAARLLEQPGISVTLMYCGADEPEMRDFVESERRELERRGIEARSVIRCGALDVAGQDLVIVATEGAGRREGMFGSFALGALNSSPVPVLVFRPRREDPEPTQFRRILVPLDGSRLADQILPYVEGLAETMGSQLVLFAAGDRARLSQVLGRRAAILSPPTSILVEDGPVIPAIQAAIRHLGIDAVALTTHGRSGLTRVIYGSTTEQLLHAAEVPFLVLNNRAVRRAQRTQESMAAPTP